MNIRPLALRPQLALGDWAAAPNNAPGSSIGRLNCFPWAMYTVPAWETWKIDVIHMENWSGADAIYSLTIEASDWLRDAAHNATGGGRWRGAYATTGSASIGWGELIAAGEKQRLVGPWWAMPTEILAGAAIPGLGAAVNCHMFGWAYS